MKHPKTRIDEKDKKSMMLGMGERVAERGNKKVRERKRKIPQ